MECRFITSIIFYQGLRLEQKKLAQEAQIEQEEKQIQASQAPDFVVSIKSLQEESLQLSELSEMEKTYGFDVISSLKQIIEPLGVSYHIKPAAISKADSSLQDVVLTPQGVVCLIHNNGILNSKTLESLQSETLVKLLSEIIPEIRTLLLEKRQKTSGRVSMLEKVAKELRKVASALPTRGKETREKPSPSPKDSQSSGDALKSALS
jgi:hypothetical protein